MFAKENIVYFDNIPMFDLTVSVSNGIESVCCTDIIYVNSYLPIRRKREYNLDFRVMVDNCDALYRKLDIWANKHYRKSEFGILGTGWLCHHCGDYNPSGSIECIKCGGQANQDFLKPMSFPFMVSELNWNCSVLDSIPDTAIVTMCGYGDKCADAIYSMMNGQGVFCANGYSLESGYYLCAYCGQAVPDGEDCPGCGGKRLTFQELVKLDRKCVYCGRQVFGGIICKGCGARIKGLTFDKAFSGKVM